MASVCYLTIDHATAQRKHLTAANQYMRELFLFDDETELDLNMNFSCAEGTVAEGVDDAFGLFHAYHDIVPFECLTPDQQTQFHNGSEYNASLVRDNLLCELDKLALDTETPPPQEKFVLELDDSEDMPVQVVNVVNTSYWWMDRYNNNHTSTLLGHRFMWRRLTYMGCQVNHVRTSIKICYAWPWNATELISHPGRILETGSDNHITANLMFHHVTLKSFQLAGMPHLYVLDRSLRNVVTTTNIPLPADKRLILPLLFHQFHQQNSKTRYEPGQFAGVIVHHPYFKKVRALIFKQGALVIVGTISIEEAKEALRSLVPQLYHSVESPETLATLAGLGPDIQKLCNVSQKVVTRKRAAGNGQLVPPGGSKKPRKR